MKMVERVKIILKKGSERIRTSYGKAKQISRALSEKWFGSDVLDKTQFDSGGYF